jgi:integrase/recombinase XerD
MGNELVEEALVSVPATVAPAALPELVKRAGGMARFAWEEFFYAERHHPHKKKSTTPTD